LTSSAALPSGSYPGEVVSIGSYKGNLPGLLSTLHLLGRKQQYLRRRTPFKDEKVLVVTPQELRKTFNAKTGLNDKSKSVPIMLLKACLATIVSTGNKVFPGGWIVSNRSMNGVKSDTGLVFKLGYAERIPDNHKLEMVLNHKTTINPKGEKTLQDQSGQDHKEWSFIEFRSGVALVAPLLDPSKPDAFDHQRKAEPLRVKSGRAIETFGNSKYYKTVDSLNRAHAILVNVQKKSKKSKPIHYEIARNEFLHNTARCPIIDGTGKEHTSTKTLPVPVREYMAKRYRWTKSPAKRSAEESDPQQEESSRKKSSLKKPVSRILSEDQEMSETVVGLGRQPRVARGGGRKITNKGTPMEVDVPATRVAQVGTDCTCTVGSAPCVVCAPEGGW